jgi:hypothetical protein
MTAGEIEFLIVPSDDNGGLSVKSSVIGTARLSETQLLPLLRSSAATEAFELPIFPSEHDADRNRTITRAKLRIAVSNRLQPKALSISWDSGASARAAAEHEDLPGPEKSSSVTDSREEAAELETRIVPGSLILKGVPDFAWKEEEKISAIKEENWEQIQKTESNSPPAGFSCEIVLTPEMLANFTEISSGRSDVYWRNNIGIAAQVYFTCALVMNEVSAFHFSFIDILDSFLMH